MLWTKLFIPTLREDPVDPETLSHRLLRRAGYIRPQTAGVYTHLFLSQRSLLKIAAIVRDEMKRIGAQEILLPVHHPPQLTVASIARELRSYKQLPQIWHQFRQTLSEDSYSFGLTPGSFDAACAEHHETWKRIFERCGVETISVGDGVSRDFLVESAAGDHFIAKCPKCGSTAAGEQPLLQPDPDGALDPEEFHTPGRKTIADIAEFTGLPETSQIKSLVMISDGEPVLALLRGDHQLSETQLAKVLAGPVELRAATPREIQTRFGATAGSLGPVGVKNLRILADAALRNRRNMIAGANKDDYHLRNVTPQEDFTPEFFPLREVSPADVCLNCGSTVEVHKALRLAHSFLLPAKLRVLDAGGKEVVPIVGSFGLSLERILSSVVEQRADKDGMILPPAIAPFTVVITPINFADAAQRPAAESIYRACLAEGLDALLDDRDERPGVKFKDADLIGIPWRIVVGKKLSDGLVEVVERRTRQSTDAPVAEVHKNLSSISTR